MRQLIAVEESEREDYAAWEGLGLGTQTAYSPPCIRATRGSLQTFRIEACERIARSVLVGRENPRVQTRTSTQVLFLTEG
jgi:hypothetical protein